MTTRMKIRSYKEVSRLKTFEERFDYLKLNGGVGVTTFGFERYLNQTLYRSRVWRSLRKDAIIRDGACDLGIPDREIIERLIVHHINPITIEDIENGNSCVYDLDNLICTYHNTHNAIHYGDSSLLARLPIERRKGDTCPWR